MISIGYRATLQAECRSCGLILEREATPGSEAFARHLLCIKFEPALLAVGGRLTDDMRGEIFPLISISSD